MKTSRWVEKWTSEFLKSLPDDPWSDYSDEEIEILERDLIPYLKGMTKELLGDNIFHGGKHGVRKKKRDDKPTEKYLVRPGGKIKTESIIFDEVHLEKVGLSYLHRGVFFTLLLYKNVFVEEDKTKAGQLSETAVRCLALGTDLVQRMRNGGGARTSDNYLKIQRVPRVSFGELDF